MLNLLSEGIIYSDGAPGPNFAKGRINSRSPLRPMEANSSAARTSKTKTLYTTLPTPDVNGVQNPPAAAIVGLGGDPGLPAADQFLFTTGGTGFALQ